MRRLAHPRKPVQKHFQKALELAPESKGVLFDYGRGLLIQNKRKNREQAREILMRALNIPPQNAFDRLLDEEAKRMLAESDE